jgi:HD-GYP domain-containing protein (c-di-GMP phosphodiesterase class II)
LTGTIATVSDVFDAQTTERPYKKAWTEEKAVNEPTAQRASAFDPTVADAFVGLYGEEVVSEIRRQFPRENRRRATRTRLTVLEGTYRERYDGFDRAVRIRKEP